MIIDKTGLTGKYDVELTWAPNNEPDAGPSIFTAIQEQLGLKLESSKAPVDVVVIDHLERPSENGAKLSLWSYLLPKTTVMVVSTATGWPSSMYGLYFQVFTASTAEGASNFGPLIT